MKFQVHTKETAPEASRVTLEATGKKYGFVPNLFGVLAESPTAVQAYAAINKALEQSALSPVEQQVVALTVSATNDCAYCVGAHSAVAQMVRMPEDILLELRDQQPLSDRKLNALRTLAMSMVHHRGWVSEEDLEQLRESHRADAARSAVCLARVERQGRHGRLTAGAPGWERSTLPAGAPRSLLLSA